MSINYSHLKFFTLPPVLAVATNMRYGRHRSSGLLLLFQECNALPPPELTLWSWLKIISCWPILSQLQNLWYFSFTEKQRQNTWISGRIEFSTGRWPITEQSTLNFFQQRIDFSPFSMIFWKIISNLEKNAPKALLPIYMNIDKFPRNYTFVSKFTGLISGRKKIHHTILQKATLALKLIYVLMRRVQDCFAVP